MAVDLKLFDSDPLAKEILEHEEFLSILNEELDCRCSMNGYYSSTPEPNNTKGEGMSTLDILENKKSIIFLRSEISSKESYIKTLKEKLLKDKEVFKAEYDAFKKERPKFFDQLNKLQENYKNVHFKAHFTYLRSELANYEAWLAREDADQHSIANKTGIIEGIVHFYTQLCYAIQDHNKYRQ